MFRSSRRMAPVAAAIVLVGCYDSSGRGPGSDGGSRGDASIAIDASIDPTCGPRAIDVACVSHVTAGEPTVLRVVVGPSDDCFCGQDVACVAHVTAPGELALDTQLCPEEPVCFACGDRVLGACSLPPLDEGEWHVRVNGESAMDLTVVPAGVVPEPGMLCTRRAIVDACGAGWEPAGFEVGRACHPMIVQEDTSASLRVVDRCGGCQQIGPCTVDVFDDVIRVRATRLPNSCDIACPPVCVETEHACLTPPLARGTYRVMVDGLASSSMLTVGSAPTTGEICVGDPVP